MIYTHVLKVSAGKTSSLLDSLGACRPAAGHALLSWHHLLATGQQRIENPLSKLLLEGRFPPKSTIPVDVDPIQNPGVFRSEVAPG